ncbi:MAG: LTA synthase family protein [Bacteroidales bacterium]|nr:LTA synthase family protein [Bacteroidales bacterium]
MVRLLKALALQFFFWMLFFAFARTVFVAFHLKHFAGIPFWEITAMYRHSLRLDMATACYILVIPGMLTVFQSMISTKWLLFLNRVYTFLMILAYSLITAAEIGIYDEWKTKLHAKSLNYLRHPEEIYNSAPSSAFIVLVLLVSILTATGFFFYKKYFSISLAGIRKNYIVSAIVVLVLPAVLFTGLRGGIQEIPIVQSQSYYSKHNILNLAATNSGFNFIHSLNEYSKDRSENPYVFFEEGKAGDIVRALHEVKSDTTIIFLKESMPNIVLIILESWSADLIESLGGMSGITPEFREIEKQGVLFTDIYASGSRSEQGMAAIFSGFPAHPLSVVTYQPDKYPGLPGLNKKLKEAGYSSTFYFGGQLIYGNIKSYIYYNEFDRIFDIENLPEDMPGGKLGVHDAFMFEKMKDDAGKVKKPFLSAIFTVSTHSPFDMPMKIREFWEEKYQNLYLNSAFYTDSCIGAFFREASSEPWFKNTLFILMPDHSHDSYKKWDYHSPPYHRTFFLFAGDVVKPEFQGKTIRGTGSQVDFPATLLAQLGLEHSAFTWSKNLMNPYAPRFASISFEEGIGWTEGGKYFFYEPRFDRFYCRQPDDDTSDSIVMKGKAYLQILFQQYLDF